MAKLKKPKNQPIPPHVKPKSAKHQVLEALADLLEEVPSEPTLPVLSCQQGCVQRAMASRIVLEALASTVWELADYRNTGNEYIVTDITLVPLAHNKQTFGVTIQARDNPRLHEEDILLHQFLLAYVPKRQLDARDYQS